MGQASTAPTNRNPNPAAFQTPPGLEDVLGTGGDPVQEFHMPAGVEDIIAPQPAPAPAPQPAPAPAPQPAPAPAPAPQPAPQPAPAPDPAPAPAATGLGYPEDSDPAFKPLLEVFKSKGVQYADVELAFADAIEAGDASKLNKQVLESMVGADTASLIAVSFDGILARAQANATQAMQKLYDAAGSKDQFDLALAYATETDNKVVLEGLKSPNDAIQILAVEKMMSVFSAKNPARAPAQQAAPANAAPAQAPAPVNLEPLSQRQYAEALYKMRQDGTWDGANYHHPEVRRLVQRLTATMNAERRREEAARAAADAAMRAYYGE